ncbi:hypothetical protein Ccrd_010506 [Cynara cardunculus var. scolymus]|uniref:Uncharacterized protein n=1 Tax=Cynara cardunculus var. scolymus TaxID=59895 RepID=A0A103YL11_CYNCS|nr:hypothetical protein Ccrd_010506 [Cynara cardunculus var. scolymus]
MIFCLFLQDILHFGSAFYTLILYEILLTLFQFKNLLLCYYW